MPEDEAQLRERTSQERAADELTDLGRAACYIAHSLLRGVVYVAARGWEMRRRRRRILVCLGVGEQDGAVRGKEMV